MSFFSRTKSNNSLSSSAAAATGSPTSSPRASRKPSPIPPSDDPSVNAATKDLQGLDVGGSGASASGSPEKDRKGFLSMRSRTSSQASLKSNKSGKSGTGVAAGPATPLKGVASGSSSRDSAAKAAGVTVNGSPAAAAGPSAGAAGSKAPANATIDENAEELPPEMTGQKWRPRPGHPGNLSPTQTTALLQLTGQLSTDGTLPPSSQFTGDDLEVPLCRFLRARNWNVSQARDMWNKSVEWKESIDLETLLRTFDFEEREKVAKAGWQMYFHKTDKLGRPIFVQDLAGLDPATVWTATTPDRIVRNFAVTLEKAVRYRYRACSAATADGRLIEDNLMILDVAGLGMGTFWNFKSQLQQLLSILDNNFPELSGRVQIINAPWLFSTIWSYLKGWLPPNTVDKIDITGSDYQGILLKFIDAESLPKRLGGKCECVGEGGCNVSDEGPWKKGKGGGEQATASCKEGGVSGTPAGAGSSEKKKEEEEVKA